MTLIAPHITAYLRERLPNERKASPHTCDTYAYAFQLLFQFASQRLGCSPAALQLEQLDAPDPNTRDGVRDRSMLHLAFTGGLRVSELVGLKLSDVTFRAGYLDIHVMGKGRKERVLTLWKTVAGSLRAWLSIRGDASVPELFLNARAQSLTRSGFRHIVNKHIPAAVNKCPSLKPKRVSPHVLRHTCALNTLEATRDIRKVALWLG